MLNDCPDLSGQASETPYTLGGISKLLRAYYSCQGITPAYRAGVSRGRISFGGLVSYVQTAATGQSSERGTITNEQHTGPAFGLGARYVFPGAREKFTVKLEGQYHSFSDVARLQTRAETSSTMIIRREFDANVVQLHLLAEVLLLTGETSVYAEGGVAASYLLDSDQSQAQITIAPDGSENRITEDLNIEVNMANGLGWLGGVGVRRGPFQLGVRASRVARIKGNSGIGFFRAGLLAGYWF